MTSRFSLLVAFTCALPVFSQSVTMGHLHIVTTDIPAHQRFWTALGGTPTKLGTIDGVRFPGVVVYFKQMQSAGGSEGSVIGHVAFSVKDLAGSLARWKAQGIPADREPGQGARQAFVTAPDHIRVEITEDATLSVPIAHHHIHFYTADVNATKAWYVKTFGARPGKRGKFEAADIPGANLTFDKATAASAPTRGRALDHIGFEVRGLEAFAKKLEAAGIKLNVPYTKRPDLGIALLFLTDPWGTYVELTEPL